jgi:uncharacterized protein (DUF1800 family)
MNIENQLKNQHLLWRAGFGIAYRDISKLGKISTHKLLKKIMEGSQQPVVTIPLRNSCVIDLTLELESYNKATMPKDDFQQKKDANRKEFNTQSNEDIKQMSLDWMDEMTFSDARLREKMALFWHGHFACIVGNSICQQQLLDIIRRNALGDFGTLLSEVSKSASMISFLNNLQNRKQHPNENFAREVMELFTMGRGNYSEEDVREAARAFTGWQYEKNYAFTFNQKIHDDGSKTILGQTGNFNGDDVLAIILKQKQTALFITRKIYRNFVNETPDEGHVSWLSERFFDNNYNIEKLMLDIFSSDWFYEPVNIGTHIKSPVEYIIGIRTLLPMTIQNEEVQILIQRLLGQWLFNPPNVAGWPGGKAWIDSSSLMLRLAIPALIKNDIAIDLKPKSNDDVQMGRKETFDVGANNKKKKPGSPYQILTTIDWQAFQKTLNEKETNELLQKLKMILIQASNSNLSDAAILSNTKNTDPITFLETATIALMSTPEYQLC